MCVPSVCLAVVRACMLCCAVRAGVDRCFVGRCQCLLTVASSASILAPAHVVCLCFVSGARGPSALCVKPLLLLLDALAFTFTALPHFLVALCRPCVRLQSQRHRDWCLGTGLRWQLPTPRPVSQRVMQLPRQRAMELFASAKVLVYGWSTKAVPQIGSSFLVCNDWRLPQPQWTRSSINIHLHRHTATLAC